MPLRWRPEPTWTLTTRTGSTVTRVDLTPHVVAWDVAFGCDFDPGSGRWTLQSATGSLLLDNSGRLFDPAAPGSLLSAGLLAVPQQVVLSLGAGGETLWVGAAVVSGASRLRGDGLVRWELRGRWWGLVRRPLWWRQRDNSPTGSTPREVARRVLRDAAGLGAAADILSPVSVWPAGVALRDVTLTETGGQAWIRLAHAMAAIPVEDRLGSLGMVAAGGIGDGRQTTVPDSQRALDDSTIDTVPAATIWGVDVVAPQIVRPAAAQRLVTTDARPDTHAVTGRYDYPDSVVGVEWSTAEPTTAAGWTIIDWQAHPDPNGARADVLRAVVRRDSASARPSGVAFLGRSLTSSSTPRVHTVTASLTDVGLARQSIQTTGPWIDDTADDWATTPWGLMVAATNAPKARARIRFPLWAEQESERPPTNVTARSGQLVPGSVARYRLSATQVVDMLTGIVHLSGAAGQVPIAEVTGWVLGDNRGWVTGVALPTTISDPTRIAPVPTPVSTPVAQTVTGDIVLEHVITVRGAGDQEVALGAGPGDDTRVYLLDIPSGDQVIRGRLGGQNVRHVAGLAAVIATLQTAAEAAGPRDSTIVPVTVSWPGGSITATCGYGVIYDGWPPDQPDSISFSTLAPPQTPRWPGTAPVGLTFGTPTTA